jgi:GMP synthase-like glutamine amidotransferase
VRVAVVRHHAQDSAGFIADAFEAAGAELTSYLFPEESGLPDLQDVDHVILLGAIPSVYDEGADRGWIVEELAWLRKADEAGVPVFGVCFGAQALCAMRGGEVVPADQKEVGWITVDTTDPAAIPAGPWLLFHGDVCLPPPDATVLARNGVGVQAFAIGRHLAVQFHPEVDEAQLRMWMEAGGRNEALKAGADPEGMLAETAAQEPASKARAETLVATALRLASAGPGAPGV